MVRLGVFHPVAGVGSILMMAGILYFVLQSLTFRKQRQKRLSISTDIRKCSWWSICLSAIFIAAGALLIANSPAIDFDVKLPRPVIDFYMRQPQSP